MPPALAASSRPQQDFDYEYERQVMSADASTSIDSFLAKSEVWIWQKSGSCDQVQCLPTIFFLLFEAVDVQSMTNSMDTGHIHPQQCKQQHLSSSACNSIHGSHVWVTKPALLDNVGW